MSTRPYPGNQYHPEIISSFLSPFPADREQIYISLADDDIGGSMLEPLSLKLYPTPSTRMNASSSFDRAYRLRFARCSPPTSWRRKFCTLNDEQEFPAGPSSSSANWTVRSYVGHPSTMTQRRGLDIQLNYFPGYLRCDYLVCGDFKVSLYGACQYGRRFYDSQLTYISFQLL
jgi:hypothetical protein